ncbi:CASTOR/POLLUX-related putative ion channel [Streptomyces sp. NBC_01235]|uniref:CASTOR/POLLUX-related putative ion channel n=1 Tax=Streptomyces sp. NBC_01235 TaxID=2903788 RepID=UPI002E11B4F5|nr:NAD-binding lipoprotein [Streptomyces sp. NBC_01235]
MRYRFDSTLARSTGRLVGWMALTCLGIVVPASALLVWTDPSSPPSFAGRLAAVWRVSAETLRLGAVTGAPLRMLLSVLLGLVALLYVSTLIGLITTGLTDRVTELRRGRSTVVETGHSVVLGWSEQVFTVVGELVAARVNQRWGAVVVLADRDKTDMEEALAAVLGPTGTTRLICRSGSTADPEALGMVSPGTAHAVLVLPDGERAGDAEAVRTLLALRATLGEKAGPPVVACVRDERYRTAARLAAGPSGIVLESDRTAAGLIVHSALHPGLTPVLRELLDFDGEEFHVTAGPGLAGRRFGDVLLDCATAAVVGLVRADGTPLLNPPPDTVLAPADRLVVVAPNDDDARWEDCRDLVEPSVMAGHEAGAEGPSRFLLLGWNRRGPHLVETLRRGARPGSVLHVVTDPAERAGPPVPLPEPRRDPALASGLTVTLGTADPTGPSSLRGLDPNSYDRVIVLGPDTEEGVDRPDDRTLVVLLILRSLAQEAGCAVPVIAELADERNRALAPLGPGSEAVVGAQLTGLLMAQVAQNRHLATVFEELFTAEGSTLRLRPAPHYVLPDRPASFATVVAAARERGECAIGYRRHDRAGTPPDHGVRLNPPKSDVRVWDHADDVVVIVTEGRGGGGAGGPGADRVARADVP